MPMVVRMLQKLTGIEPDRTVNPDEAVARGAALYAGHVLAAAGGGPGRHLRGDQRQRPQPGHRRHRTGDPPQDQHHPHSPQHAPARQAHGALRDQVGRAAIHRRQGVGGGKHAAGRVYRHRPHRGPRPARRAAQGLAGRNHLRVCDQRAAERAGDGAGDASPGRSWPWSARWGSPATGIARWKGRSRRPRGSTSSRWRSTSRWPRPTPAAAAGSSGILARSAAGGSHGPASRRSRRPCRSARRCRRLLPHPRRDRLALAAAAMPTQPEVRRHAGLLPPELRIRRRPKHRLSPAGRPRSVGQVSRQPGRQRRWAILSPPRWAWGRLFLAAVAAP